MIIDHGPEAQMRRDGGTSDYNAIALQSAKTVPIIGKSGFHQASKNHGTRMATARRL